MIGSRSPSGESHRDSHQGARHHGPAGHWCGRVSPPLEHPLPAFHDWPPPVLRVVGHHRGGPLPADGAHSIV